MHTELHQHVTGTLVEIFGDNDAAQAAVKELKAAGFSDEEIEIVCHKTPVTDDVALDERTEIEESASMGAAAGFGIGALCGLGILVGVTPNMLPVAGVGALGVLLSGAAGAATVGTAGALIGIGAVQENSVRRENRTRPAHTTVIVKAGHRADIASSVLNRFNGSMRLPSQAM